ncbi:DUF3021 family protein [Bombilactobacillus mellis]|uniref:DUF3021 family protein n=1 Tax=Bombilactobacillus mellis TaxID=1218508 RepID=UPI00158106C0|nr:DUF3021 family protein [Bombilactobacillus mellis]NUF25909.1 DUF3021 domain-containing protein [Bombilactobacillus mellis]
MNYILSAIIRGSIPFIIMSLLSGIMKFQRLNDYQVKSTFITGLIVTAVVAASVIYEVESWSLIKQSIIHFLIMLITVYPCLVFSNWFPNKTVLDLVKIFGLFLIVGIILWTVAYILFGKILK